MTFWQIVWDVSQPDLSALSALIVTLSTRTHAKCQNAHFSSLRNWSGQSRALCLNLLDYTSFLYSLPSKWVSVMLFCQWTSEPATWRNVERKSVVERERQRERENVTCHSTSQSVESFLLIHHSTFRKKKQWARLRGKQILLAPILLSLLIMWDNYSYMLLLNPSSTSLPLSLPSSLPSSLISVATWINKRKIKTQCYRRQCQQLRSLPGLSAAWLDQQWQWLGPVHPGPDS